MIGDRAGPRRLAQVLRRAGVRAAPARGGARGSARRSSELLHPARSSPEAQRVGVPVAPFPRWLRCPLCSLPGARSTTGCSRCASTRGGRSARAYVHEGCPTRATPADRVPGPLPDGLRRTATSTTSPGSSSCTAATLCHGDTLRLRELGAGGRAGDVQRRVRRVPTPTRRLSQAFGDEARAVPSDRAAAAVTRTSGSPSLRRSRCDDPARREQRVVPRADARRCRSRRTSGRLAQAVDEAWSILERVPPAARPSSSPEDQRRPEEARRRSRRRSASTRSSSPRSTERRSGLGDGDPRRPAHPRVAGALDAPADAGQPTTSSSAPVARAGRLRRRDRRRRARRAPARGQRAARLHAARRARRPRRRDEDASRALLAREPHAGCRAARCAARASSSAFPEDPIARVGGRRYRASGRQPPSCGTRTGAWRSRGGLARPEDGWPGERYVLLHSFAHALIRELALECGYTRVVDSRADLCRVGRRREPMAGRPALHRRAGQRGHARRARQPRRARAARPAAAPGARARAAVLVATRCAPSTTRVADGSVHDAACHACQFASETSCERGNRYLDRAALVDTFTAAGAAYFRAR